MSRIIYTSTRSKKKAHKKPGWREAEEQHRKFLMKLGIDPDAPKKKKEFVPYVPKPQYTRETTSYPSLSNKMTGSTAKPEPKVYSGDYIVGIATMHKSNAVPVGRGDDPKDYATMRRN